MRLEKVSVSYSVEVETEKFLALLEYEDVFQGGMRNSEPSLEETLRNMGCDHVDYDGHYLNYIYFTVPTEDDNRKFHNKILKAIENQIKKAELWKQEKDNV